jgi:seryl-tRNA synthetase
MREGKKDEAETIKQEVKKINEELIEIEQKEEKYKSEIKEIMLKIPNIIHETVPIRKR